ncbi:MAG: hypothetical protein AAGP08_09990 [Pseudomonadota bacterium]
MTLLRGLIAVMTLVALSSVTWAETRLLMAEEPGCYWCAQWNEAIGPIYPKTAEGAVAPLERYDILHPPADVAFARSVNFTPTFVLVRDGVELSRIEGYPGEDFFWGLLGMMLDKAGITPEPAG